MLTDMGGTVDSIIRYRYNPMAYETPGGEWTWRVILERRSGGFEEVLVKKLYVNVPSFSRADDMAVVGRNHHMACYGVFRHADGIGTIDPH